MGFAVCSAGVLRDLESAQVRVEPSGELQVAACGEQHLNSALRLLRYEVAADVPLRVGAPLVCYRETVSRATAQDCSARSPDELSWLSMKVVPRAGLYSSRPSSCGHKRAQKSRRDGGKS